MSLEIERKFLVDKEKWESVKPQSGEKIYQGYLLSTKALTVRVRVKGDKGFFTIKGETVNISRSEFEYEIPKEDVKAILNQFCDKWIEKTRYEINVGSHLWEVDEFDSPQKGLLLAEIELTSEEEEFQLPNWVTEEVSDKPEYYNANMLS